ETSWAESADAEEPAAKYPDFRSALRSQMHVPARLPEITPSPRGSYQGLLVGVALTLGGLVMLRSYLPVIGALLNRRFNPWTPIGAAAGLSKSLLVEEQSFAKFVNGFRLGPHDTSVQTAQTDDV